MTAINAATLGALEVLARAAERTPLRDSARSVAAILMATIAVKTALEAAETLVLPAQHPALTASVVACIAIGLVSAALRGRPLLSRRALQQFSLTGSEKVLLAALTACLVALQAPHITR